MQEVLIKSHLCASQRSPWFYSAGFIHIGRISTNEDFKTGHSFEYWFEESSARLVVIMRCERQSLHFVPVHSGEFFVYILLSPDSIPTSKLQYCNLIRYDQDLTRKILLPGIFCSQFVIYSFIIII